jgi:hypothetical protein
LHKINAIKKNSSAAPTLFKRGFASEVLTIRFSWLFPSFARLKRPEAFAKPENPSFKMNFGGFVKVIKKSV